MAWPISTLVLRKYCSKITFPPLHLVREVSLWNSDAVDLAASRTVTYVMKNGATRFRVRAKTRNKMNNPRTRESGNLGLCKHILESEDLIDCECPKNRKFQDFDPDYFSSSMGIVRDSRGDRRLRSTEIKYRKTKINKGFLRNSSNLSSARHFL